MTGVEIDLNYCNLLLARGDILSRPSIADTVAFNRLLFAAVPLLLLSSITVEFDFGALIPSSPFNNCSMQCCCRRLQTCIH